MLIDYCMCIAIFLFIGTIVYVCYPRRKVDASNTSSSCETVNVIAIPERQFIINLVMDENEVDTSKYGDIIINSSQYIRQAKNDELGPSRFYRHQVNFTKYYTPEFKWSNKIDYEKIQTQSTH